MEMISAKALHYNDKKTLSLLQTDKREAPLAVQIFGSDPLIMAEGAKKALHADVAVDVILSDTSMPVPEYVRISGNVAPYAKQQLINIIERELGVAEENQIWQ